MGSLGQYAQVLLRELRIGYCQEALLKRDLTTGIAETENVRGIARVRSGRSSRRPTEKKRECQKK